MQVIYINCVRQSVVQSNDDININTNKIMITLSSSSPLKRSSYRILTIKQISHFFSLFVCIFHSFLVFVLQFSSSFILLSQRKNAAMNLLFAFFLHEYSEFQGKERNKREIILHYFYYFQFIFIEDSLQRLTKFLSNKTDSVCENYQKCQSSALSNKRHQ